MFKLSLYRTLYGDKTIYLGLYGGGGVFPGGGVVPTPPVPPVWSLDFSKAMNSFYLAVV